MTRRLLLLLSLAAALFLSMPAGLGANAEKDVADVIRAVAGALSAGKVELFLGYFDPSMPDFDKLRHNVVGLTSQAEIGCNIEILSNEGDDAGRTLTLDWILEADSRDDTPGTARRQKTVKCRLKKTGKQWRIVSFDPLDLFAPSR
jgi:hypothetical protein